MESNRSLPSFYWMNKCSDASKYQFNFREKFIDNKDKHKLRTIGESPIVIDKKLNISISKKKSDQSHVDNGRNMDCCFIEICNKA